MRLSGLAPAALPCLVLYAAAWEVREEILVVVNGHVITRREYLQAVEQGAAALYRMFSGQELDAKLRTTREKTLQGMIDSYVIEDKAADLGLTINDDQLRAWLTSMEKENNIPSDADLERALRSSLGIGLKEYMMRAREDLLKQEVLRKEVFSRIAVEDQELLAYYNDHKDEFREATRFRIRELVLPRGGTPEEQQDAESKLAAIQASLKQGTPFETLVEQYSTAPSRSTGGDLGWLGKGVLRPEVEAAALALKKGQVSPPVKTATDICLVQLTDEEMDKYKPFTEVRAAILAKLQEPKAESAIESYIQSLRIRANIRYMVPRETILKG
jgi:peptidyl-prolyl cis-trans isomerase SurA